MMAYFISLSEDLARGRAGSSGLSYHVGTFLQRSDSGAGRDRTRSTLQPFRCHCIPCYDCKGCVLCWLAQTPRWLRLTFHQLSPSLPPSPPFLPSFLLIHKLLWSVHHGPSPVAGTGTPRWTRLHGAQGGVGLLEAWTRSCTGTTSGHDNVVGGQCAQWEMPKARSEASLAVTPVSTLELLEPDAN